MPTTNEQSGTDLHRFAEMKIERVLGPDRARVLLDRLLGELEIEIRTPHDLYRLSQAMKALGGIEGAVGAMLGVAAVLRGGGPSS